MASEKDSGREKVERSVSSDQGRRSERERRTESLSRERKTRKAGAAADSDPAGTGAESGSEGGGGGAEEAIGEGKGKAEDEMQIFENFYSSFKILRFVSSLPSSVYFDGRSLPFLSSKEERINGPLRITCIKNDELE